MTELHGETRQREEALHRLRVECFQDGEATVPVRFGVGDASQEVVELLDRWPGADHCYFHVRTRDGGCFILRHDEPADAWEISVFEAEGE